MSSSNIMRSRPLLEPGIKSVLLAFHHLCHLCRSPFCYADASPRWHCCRGHRGSTEQPQWSQRLADRPGREAKTRLELHDLVEGWAVLVRSGEIDLERQVDRRGLSRDSCS